MNLREVNARMLHNIMKFHDQNPTVGSLEKLILYIANVQTNGQRMDDSQSHKLIWRLASTAKNRKWQWVSTDYKKQYMI